LGVKSKRKISTAFQQQANVSGWGMQMWHAGCIPNVFTSLTQLSPQFKSDSMIIATEVLAASISELPKSLDVNEEDDQQKRKSKWKSKSFLKKIVNFVTAS